MYAGGCEWRIDVKAGRVACLGVITREPVRAARFAVEKGRVLLVLTPAAAGPDLIFERVGDGDYKPLSIAAPATPAAKLTLVSAADGTWQFVCDGFVLGPLQSAVGSTPTLAEISDGKVFLTAGHPRITVSELTGIETFRPLTNGKVTLPPR